MPCGGGDIGLNVWVENNELLFYMAKSGTFDENNRLKVTNPETASIIAGSAKISADSRWGVNSGFSGKTSGVLSTLTIE